MASGLMLKLRRKQGESIVVIPQGSGPVRVTVIEVDGPVVRIGFEADASTEIYREEVWRRVVEERRAIQ
jgi:carbon storage regulator